MGLYTKIIDIQKLNKAWERIRKNKPACGVDGVTWEEFDEGKREQLKQLHLELSERRYHPQAVKLIQLFQEEKEREVSLYTMRDKVVQNSLTEELGKIFFPLFSKCVYAYRPGVSALQAVNVIDERLKLGIYSDYFRGDIRKFFDHIQFDRLYQMLQEKIAEEEVLELIQSLLSVKGVNQEGELVPKTQGVYQGSVLAPLLSNVYLMEFDKGMQKRASFYVRYSDDFVALAKGQEEAESMKSWAEHALRNLGLSLNADKTFVDSIKKGFCFLGYQFYREGKSIPQKAKQHLQQSLEAVWLEKGDMNLEERLEKCMEIRTGWKQYYQEERQADDILELVVSVYGGRKTGLFEEWENGVEGQGQPMGNAMKKVAGNRRELHNIYPDVMKYLAAWWHEEGHPEQELYEYEDYFEWHEQGNYEIFSLRKELLAEVLERYAHMEGRENAEDLMELMQLYTDIGLYRTAGLILQKLRRLEENGSERRKNNAPAPMQAKEPEHITIKDLNEYMDLFVGREDLYAEEREKHGHRRYEEVLQPFTMMELRVHLAGERTLATYVQRSNATAHFLVLDIDISKKVLLSIEGTGKFQHYYGMAGEYAKNARDLLRKMGLKGYIEESGYRGYHIWIFFDEWISVRYINMLSDQIEGQIEKNDDIIVEFFPNKTHLKPGRAGQMIKLPCGIHSKTGRFGFMCGENLQPVEDMDGYMHGIVRYSLNELKRILSKTTKIKPSERRSGQIDLEEKELENLNTGIVAVLRKCSLMRYFYLKAKRTGYLTHGERLSVLYVFGHLGPDGKGFVHTIMEFTMNYQYHVTQRFIDRLPLKPVSCTKLREQYKQITAEYGCSCNFKRSKNCYPSPVLHAAKLSNGEKLEVTVPTARTLSKEKEKKVREELNLPIKVLELAKRMQELKKQKRGLEKSIIRVQTELGEIFDGADIDCMEIDMGLLCRRKAGEGEEWFIEL